MILFSFGEKIIQKMDAIKSGSKYRWVFKIEKWWMGFVRQSKDNYSGWIDSDWEYIVSIKPFKFGRFHDFYDGESLYIGWIHFQWKSEDCEECYNQFISRIKRRIQNES